MLSKQRIQTIIEAQGMTAYFRENVSKHGNGTSKTYVRAYRREANQRIIFDLGPIEQVEQMNQDELVETIKHKFAEKLAMKLQVSNNS
jgi:hypothetical protein